MLSRLFITSSIGDVLIQYYKGQKSFGLDQHFLELDNWVENTPRSQKENLPLLIEADEGTGKKTLLVKWMEHRKQTSTKVFQDS